MSRLDDLLAVLRPAAEGYRGAVLDCLYEIQSTGDMQAFADDHLPDELKGIEVLQVQGGELLWARIDRSRRLVGRVDQPLDATLLRRVTKRPADPRLAFLQPAPHFKDWVLEGTVEGTHPSGKVLYGAIESSTSAATTDGWVLRDADRPAWPWRWSTSSMTAPWDGQRFRTRKDAEAWAKNCTSRFVAQRYVDAAAEYAANLTASMAAAHRPE